MGIQLGHWAAGLFPAHRVGLRALLVLGMAGIAMVGVGIAPAAGHAGLVTSDPVDGAQLPENPGAVTLRFNEEIPVELAAVSLIEADGVVELPVSAVGPTAVRAELDGTETGRLRVTYRVTSADGHPIVGDLSFFVRGDPGPPRSGRPDTRPGTPSEGSPRGGNAADPLDDTRSSELSAEPAGADAAPGTDTPWLLVGAGLGGLALLLGIVTMLRRALRDDP